MTRQLRRTAPLALFLGLSLLAGCESGPKTIPVSGTVTLDGKPLPEGVVYFKTVQTGALETFTVKDGKFAGNAEEGDRRVEISAYRTRTQNLNGMESPIKESLIPARYNTDSQLTATVRRGGPNTFQFDVTSQ